MAENTEPHAATDDIGPDPSLLLVDDDAPFLRRLARAMETRGFAVDTAESVAEGIAKALRSANPFGDGPQPQPGEGPSKEERESGFYSLLFIGEYPDGATVRASVKGDRDPGYGSTSKMIAESALTLLEQDTQGGVVTPGGIIAEPLLKRLQQNAGLEFAVEA